MQEYDIYVLYYLENIVYNSLVGIINSDRLTYMGELLIKKPK